MDEALAEIEFLALSANRVAVLQSLAAGRRTRNELAEETGASQATLGRILGDFQERSWIQRDGSEYRATATGELVASGFTDLLEIIETERELRGIVRYLPADALEFDLAQLANATVTTPTQTRPNAPVQRAVELIRDASDVRAFSHAFNDQSLRAVEEQVTSGEGTFRAVFSRSAIDPLADDAGLRERLASLLAADGAEIRIRDEDVPVAVTVADNVVHLLLRDEDGVLRASVDSDDVAVCAWARDTFDRYWEWATPLERGDLPD